MNHCINDSPPLHLSFLLFTDNYHEPTLHFVIFKTPIDTCYTYIILIPTTCLLSEYGTSKLGRCITQAEQALGFGTFVDEGSVLARDDH